MEQTRQDLVTQINQQVIVLEECKKGDLFDYVMAAKATRDQKMLKYLML